MSRIIPTLDAEQALDTLNIIVQPADVVNGDFCSDWLTFQCLGSDYTWTFFGVRDLDDPKITELIGISLIRTVTVDVRAIAPTNSQIIYQWTKLRDVAWILLRLLFRFNQLSIRLHDNQPMPRHARRVFREERFAMHVEDLYIQCDCNFLSLVSMALILPIIMELRQQRNLAEAQPRIEIIDGLDLNMAGTQSSPVAGSKYRVFDMEHPSRYLPGHDIVCQALWPRSDVYYQADDLPDMFSQLTKFHADIDDAVDEIKGIEGNLLRRERMRLHETSDRSCLSSEAQEKLQVWSRERRDRHLRIMLDPHERELPRMMVRDAWDRLPRQEISPHQLEPHERDRMRERWKQDYWADLYPRGIPPLQPLYDSLLEKASSPPEEDSQWSGEESPESSEPIAVEPVLMVTAPEPLIASIEPCEVSISEMTRRHRWDILNSHLNKPIWEREPESEGTGPESPLHRLHRRYRLVFANRQRIASLRR
ncbi:hypothetical protein PFICI_06876 [Pestalotiopsis fici W106-1]|uniref:Uncharacterized protein n=1 Tax=Pestalotiopsis fici (strain W106-1 / CGMCC3.15140) TaxID=1229662 RepID=W3X767_PESFW|nr:uncharacterized protein PFICI_06876 [Pestalotiopsis fici W106-1]ETS81874.1 hypothetical protein PFICI_06876 [Pestalotiopsis fici W106-1]